MENLKSWQKVIVWILMVIAEIGFGIFIVLMSAKFGLILWDQYKGYGLFGILVFILGVFGVGVVMITINFVTAVIRRIFKLKWLQLPIE